MAIRKAFLSSTGKDLAEYRQAVFEAINGLDGWKCVRMEDFGARPRPIHEFDADAVRECDLFIGILGHCYGTIPRSHRKSYTEQEYDAAVTLPRLMFIAPDDFPLPARLREPEEYWKRQQSFRDRVQADQLAGRFSTPASLANEVLQAIRNWEAQKPPPWGDGADAVAPASSSDRLARLLTYPRSFIEDFFTLVTGPKRFVAVRSAAGTLTIGRALGFFAVTTLIVWIMPSDFRLEHHIGGDVVFLFAQLIAYALVLFLAWRSVGGKAAFGDYIPTYIYFSAIYILLIMVTVTTFMGALHAFDPTLYGNIVQAVHEGDVLQYVLSPAYSEAGSKSPLVVVGIGIVGGSLIILWSLACWGAYRDLNHASRLRSTMAGFIFIILSVFAYGVLATLDEAFVAALTSA